MQWKNGLFENHDFQVNRLKNAISRSKMTDLSGVSLQDAMEEAREVFEEAEGWLSHGIEL